MEENTGEKRLRRQARRKKLWLKTAELWENVRQLHRRGNARFAGKRSDAFFTAVSVGVIAIVAAVMLWLPAYLGMGNDGTVTRTMANAGLGYLEADRENANDYFTRVYQTGFAAPEDRSVQLTMIKLAKSLDDLVTGDQLFDIRFLSALYLLLALPGWALLIHAAVGRANAFVEKCVLAVGCVLVFADVSYITYFNSLYPEALLLIGLSYFFGGCMNLQKRSRMGVLYWVSIVFGTVLLCATRRHCAIVSLAAAIFCIAQFRLSEGGLERVGIALCAGAVLMAGLWSLAFAENDFDDTSRVHAMTRGVLLQSGNPEKTLTEFGIDGSYAMLTDISLYDRYPLTEESEYYLQNGFLSEYTGADIALYYLRHPGALVSMLDLGVRSAMNTRREYCGNYERSANMPAGARSIFFGAYSVFKSRSLPHTLAFPLLLAIVCGVLSRGGWWRKKEPDRFYYVYFCTTMAAAFVAAAHLTEIVCLSGDAQLTQYNFLAGYSLDCLLLFTLSELLHRLNILEEAQVNKS